MQAMAREGAALEYPAAPGADLEYEEALAYGRHAARM
jgi:hypothetical protein